MKPVMVRLKLEEFFSNPLSHFTVTVLFASSEQSPPGGNVRSHRHSLDEFFSFFEQSCTPEKPIRVFNLSEYAFSAVDANEGGISAKLENSACRICVFDEASGYHL
nr:Small heat shock protein, chloroplastic [Ipomoea trifida]